MDALTVPAILSAGMSALAGTVVFLFLRLEKAHDRERDLHEKLAQKQEAHKEEVKSLQKEQTDILLTQTEKHFEAQAPVMRLLEATIGTTRPK